jgi:hypothetical protein
VWRLYYEGNRFLVDSMQPTRQSVANVPAVSRQADSLFFSGNQVLKVRVWMGSYGGWIQLEGMTH